MKRCWFNLVVLLALLLASTGYAQSPAPDVPDGFVAIDGAIVPGQAPLPQPSPAPTAVPEGWTVVNGLLSQAPSTLPPPAPAEAAPGVGIQGGVLLEGGEPGPQVQNPAGESLRQAAAGDGPCSPSGLIRINFDETTRPSAFMDTTALRTDYRLQGVLFGGPAEKDGGAVVQAYSWGGITGYSPPNILGFNVYSTLQDGGHPVLPEDISFPGEASYVRIGAASNAGTPATVVMEAFDKNGGSLGSDSFVLSLNLQFLEVSARHISRVQIRSTTPYLLLDDLAYTPEDYLEALSFDETTRPAYFINTLALRADYQGMGLLFSGAAVKDGGAVLNGSTFAVSGYSAPNFLAFNTASGLSDGGIPRPPETIDFSLPLKTLTLFVATSATAGDVGNPVTLQAFDETGVLIGADSTALATTIKPLSVSAGSSVSGIARVVISSPAVVMIVDDLLFVRLNVRTIDFDDAPAPPTFSQTTALRDRYEDCRVSFSGPAANDGGAILDELGSFGVSGYSARNFLAFNTGSSLSNGGIPRTPQTIHLLHPAEYLLVYAGSNSGAGQLVTMSAYNQSGGLLGSTALTLAPQLQPLRLLAPGIRRVVITTPANVMVLDNLTIVFEPWNTFLPMVSRSP